MPSVKNSFWVGSAVVSLFCVTTALAVDSTGCVAVTNVSSGNSFENVRVKVKSTYAEPTPTATPYPYLNFADATGCSSYDNEAITLPEVNQFTSNSSLLAAANKEQKYAILTLDGCMNSRRKIVGVQLFSNSNCS